MELNDTIAFSIDKEREKYHKKMKKRKTIRFSICAFIWLLIGVFLLTPFSSYKAMKVNGNVYLSKMEVIELAGIKNTLWWLVDNNKLKEKLETNINIDNVSVSKNFNGLHISILENYPIAIKDNKYALNTGLELLEKDKYPKKIDNLIDISALNDEQFALFMNKYINVDLSVREYFYSVDVVSEEIINMLGVIDNIHFSMKINISSIANKLTISKFSNIKEEIIGKYRETNIEYNHDNPMIINYCLEDINSYVIK